MIATEEPRRLNHAFHASSMVRVTSFQFPGLVYPHTHMMHSWPFRMHLLLYGKCRITVYVYYFILAPPLRVRWLLESAIPYVHKALHQRFVDIRSL